MPSKQITPNSEIDAYLLAQIKKREQFIINLFTYVGESCLKEARENGSYKDRTGNLRSSIGYVIVVDGKIVTSSGFKGSEGGSQGSSFARTIASQFSSGIALVVVAGMKYSSYVAARGYNVLDSAELVAERLVPTMMKQLGFTVK